MLQHLGRFHDNGPIQEANMQYLQGPEQKDSCQSSLIFSYHNTYQTTVK